jgi:uncharacterized protein
MEQTSDMIGAFKNAQGAVVDLESEILNFVSDKDYTYQIFIGTDSQLHKKYKHTLYATVVVLHKKGKGGRIFLKKEEGEILKSLRERLLRETWSTLEVAFELSKIIPSNCELILHIDVNKSKRFKSGNYVEELVGMVTGNGFQCRVKPDAWAAQTIADRFSK